MLDSCRIFLISYFSVYYTYHFSLIENWFFPLIYSINIIIEYINIVIVTWLITSFSSAIKLWMIVNTSFIGFHFNVNVHILYSISERNLIFVPLVVNIFLVYFIFFPTSQIFHFIWWLMCQCHFYSFHNFGSKNPPYLLTMFVKLEINWWIDFYNSLSLNLLWSFFTWLNF